MQLAPQVSPSKAVPLLLGAVLGCAGAPEGGAFTSRDSAGVEIVENRGVAGQATLGQLLDFDEVRSFPGLELAYVGGMQLMADGRVVIANGGTAELVFLDTRSGNVTTSGRRGEGPGEYQAFRRISRCGGDSVAVQSFPDRLTVVDQMGRYGRMVRVVAFRPDEHVGVTHDCASAAYFRMDLPPGYQSGDPQPLSVHWVRGADSVPIQITSVYGHEATPIRGIRGHARRPFGSHVVSVVVEDALVLGRNDSAEVRTFRQDGTVARILRWQGERLPVTDDDRKRYAEIVEHLIAEPYGEEYAMLRLDRISLPEAKPLYSRILGDDRGNLWVQGYPEQPSYFDNRGVSIFGPEGRIWWIFDATGRLVGTGTTPENFMIHDIRDGMVAGVLMDPDGVQVATIVPLGAALRGALAAAR